MRKLFPLLLVLLGFGVDGLKAQTCPAGPPQSRYDGSTVGTPLPNGGRQFNFEYAKVGGFDCFELLSTWYPVEVHSYSSISPSQTALDMAYATAGTATFSNVVVPTKGNYTLAVRYAYNSGHFPGITDRPEGIRVNGVVITYDMHFPITYSFEHYEYSTLIVPLNAGQNSIQVFNVSDHGVGRLDTMLITASGNEICSDAPSTPGGLTSQLLRGIDLTWTSSTWPADCKLRYYDVYRSTSSGFIPSAKNRIATGLGVTSYADLTALCGTTYYYLVQAVDTAGASASVQKTVATKPCSASIPAGLPAQKQQAAD